jgi:choline dehydrogenase-like flavoprotein
MAIFVVGSGPAGVSAAFSLLRKGLSVTMLDVGFRLEPHRQQIVERLASGTPESWDNQTLDDLRNATKASARGLTQKLIYGSDFPYRTPKNLVQFLQSRTDLVFSHALGGLSTAWGANAIPFLEQDISDWPIELEELTPYYSSVFGFVNLSAREDRLTQLFQLHTAQYHPLKPSRQAEVLLAELERNRERLTQYGFEFGQSRLAVRAYPKGRDAGCVYCGLCLYGCPYGLIYSSAQSLPELQQFPNFKYVPGHYVERLVESSSVVTIHTRRVSDGEPEQFSAERVFLGCGTVSTTKIILESLGAWGQEILVRDSQYFLTPLLHSHAVPDVTEERLHTLSQICLVLRDTELSTRSIHMLIYTYNDLYRRALERLCPVRAVQKALLSRLAIIQGYLHSDDSATLTMRVERASGTAPTRVVLEGQLNPRTRATVRQVLRRLRAVAPGFIVPLMTNIVAPGKSYHVGASLPMRARPGDFECDVLGRPTGLARVHLVDASCFSSVPATNVTLTVMANAYRIADQSVQS